MVVSNDLVDRGVHHFAVLERGHQSLRTREYSWKRSGVGLGEPGVFRREHLLVRIQCLCFRRSKARKWVH